MTDWNRSLRPARMPSGMPMASDRTTAPSVSASVSRLDSHSPSRPKARKPATITTAMRRPAKISPIAPASTVTPGHVRPMRMPWRRSKRPAIDSRMVLTTSTKTRLELRFASTQSRRPLSDLKNSASSSWGRSHWFLSATKRMALTTSRATPQKRREVRHSRLARGRAGAAISRPPAPRSRPGSGPDRRPPAGGRRRPRGSACRSPRRRAPRSG